MRESATERVPPPRFPGPGFRQDKLQPGSMCLSIRTRASARLLGPGSGPGQRWMLSSALGSITTTHPPFVILGLDPGIRCIGQSVKGLGSAQARRITTSAALADALRIPGSSPRMTRGRVMYWRTCLLPPLASRAKAEVHVPFRMLQSVGKSAGSRIMSGTAMGVRLHSRFHHRHLPHPLRAILGLDPGIRCMGKPVKGLGSAQARRITTSAALADALRIPGSSPRMTRGRVMCWRTCLLPPLASRANAGAHMRFLRPQSVDKAAGSRIMSGTAMGVRLPSRFHHHHLPHPLRVILGLDPGICCIGQPMKGLETPASAQGPLTGLPATLSPEGRGFILPIAWRWIAAPGKPRRDSLAPLGEKVGVRGLPDISASLSTILPANAVEIETPVAQVPDCALRAGPLQGRNIEVGHDHHLDILARFGGNAVAREGHVRRGEN